MAGKERKKEKQRNEKETKKESGVKKKEKKKKREKEKEREKAKAREAITRREGRCWRLERYVKKVLLFGRDEKEEECICNFFNPSCQKGFRGECEEVECLIDRFGDIEECFKNKKRYHSKDDVI